MFDKKKISQRMKQARESLPNEVNASQFVSKAPNVDVSQYIKYEKGGPMGMEKIMELCSKWGINQVWVLTGIGEMFAGAQSLPPAPKNVAQLKSRDPELSEAKEDLREARKTIDRHVSWLQQLVDSSLGKLIEGQGGGLAIVLEILNRDVRREANGNPEKEKEIRAEIAQRIGPKLNVDLQADISADAGR